LGLEYWTAALAALIFALHPIHIEPVAWISAASDTMVAMFVALAFAAFLCGRDPKCEQSCAWRVASLGAAGVRAVDEGNGGVFPALVGIYVWLYPATSGNIGRGKDSVGCVNRGGSVRAGDGRLRAAAKARAAALQPGSSTQVTEWMDVVRTLPLVLAIYLRQLLLPVGMTGLYYTPYVTGAILTQVVAPSVRCWVPLVGLWYWNRREGKLDGCVCRVAGCSWDLAPALYLRNFGNGDFVRDRYMYLPSIGFAILAAMGLPAAAGHQGDGSAQAVQTGMVIVLCMRLCWRIPGAAGVLGKRPVGVRRGDNAVSGESICRW
jgi:hypothetical protein